jgi:D-3-phosphoglycerate dehydrogenase
MHRNVPNMIGQFSTILAEDGINIANMTNKSRNAYAYTMIDVENQVTDEIVEDLKKVKEVLRVRVIA